MKVNLFGKLPGAFRTDKKRNRAILLYVILECRKYPGCTDTTQVPHTQKFLLDFSLLNKLSLTCKSVYFHVPDCKKWGGVKGYLRYKVIFFHKVVLDV